MSVERYFKTPIKMVGVERFELPTSCSQSRRATRLRYTPNTASKGLQIGEHHTVQKNSGQTTSMLFKQYCLYSTLNAP